MKDKKLSTFIVLVILVVSTSFAESCKKDDPEPDAGYQLIVVTPDTPVTDYDGNTYQTVKIGNQIWMAENLRSKHYSDGSPVQYLEYNNDTANVKIYGRIYTAADAMRGAVSSNSNPSGVKGIAPDGWHFPSETEWMQLVNYLGGVDEAGGKMKVVGTTYWMTPNTGATNESGFTALPAGNRDFAMGFVGRGRSCLFVTSTQPSARESMIINIGYDYTNVFFFGAHPDDAGSVRCVKD